MSMGWLFWTVAILMGVYVALAIIGHVDIRRIGKWWR